MSIPWCRRHQVCENNGKRRHGIAMRAGDHETLPPVNARGVEEVAYGTS